MVLQTVHEEFTSICINVLDVFESSINCKGTIFSGINCQQGPASWFDDARDGNQQHLAESAAVTAPSRTSTSNEIRDQNQRESPDDIVNDDEAENLVTEMMDLSISSFRRRPVHRRNDSSLSVASTVSQAMYFPSDDDIFRMNRGVWAEHGTDDVVASAAATDDTASINSRPPELKLQRCIAFSQEESGCENNNVYPCYPNINSTNSNSNRSRLHSYPFPAATILGSNGSDNLPFLVLEKKSREDDEA